MDVHQNELVTFALISYNQEQYFVVGGCAAAYSKGLHLKVGLYESTEWLDWKCEFVGVPVFAVLLLLGEVCRG